MHTIQDGVSNLLEPRAKPQDMGFCQRRLSDLALSFVVRPFHRNDGARPKVGKRAGQPYFSWPIVAALAAPPVAQDLTRFPVPQHRHPVGRSGKWTGLSCGKN